MSMQPVLDSFFQFTTQASTPFDGLVCILGSKSATTRLKTYKSLIEAHALPYQKKAVQNSKDLADKRQTFFSGAPGPVWILQDLPLAKNQHEGLMDESVYSLFRDLMGPIFTQAKSQRLQNLQIEFFDVNEEIVRGVIVGLELSAYHFLSVYTSKKVTEIKINLKKQSGAQISTETIKKAQTEARAVQIARHLVNLPPNDLNPETYEKMILKQMKFPSTVKVSVWDHEKLAAEKMNLILAVGQGSATPPRMIHLKYRPTKKTSAKPIAFVGKGITFDTGGLDIKPSSGMRLMKKDMGGSAAVVALAYWVAHSNYKRPCDFYLALAENSVDAAAMRPSDLYRSRAGFLVEIDNTDAEGRLVLADVMDVAVTQKGKDEPEILIDIATLTGAIKVALGAEMAGLFSNDDALASQLASAGQKSGDLNWRMPLLQKYFGSLSSPFADFKNSADGFGGAITAALFLEKFCRGKKWAHLDVYSWNDKPNGALLTTGGSGQPVQAMIQWLKTISR